TAARAGFSFRAMRWCLASRSGRKTATESSEFRYTRRCVPLCLPGKSASAHHEEAPGVFGYVGIRFPGVPAWAGGFPAAGPGAPARAGRAGPGASLSKGISQAATTELAKRKTQNLCPAGKHQPRRALQEHPVEIAGRGAADAALDAGGL